MRYIGWLATAAFAISTIACTPQTETPYQGQTADSTKLSAELKPKEIRRAANHVADWQLSEYDLTRNNFREEERASELPEGWVNATLNIGLLHWAEVSNQERYRRAVKNLSEVNQWKPGPRVYDADDHAMGQVYLDLYEIYGEERMLKPTKSTLDKVVANPSDVSLVFDSDKREITKARERVFDDQLCRQRWCWADAIFMGPPVFFELSRITGDSKYAEFANSEFWETTEYLYNAEDNLYLRDSRYFDQYDEQGNLIYWGRGNGWVLAGIARILDQMPEDFSDRDKYLRVYRDMADRLVELQQEDGNWRSSLLDQNAHPVPESSGTGLILFALAWGLNNDILEGEEYHQSVKLGWKALVDAVQPPGKLGWVQQVGFAPGSATADDTQLYGVGAFLLAAAELYKLSATEN